MGNRLIGLAGNAGAGKDTVGQILREVAGAHTLAFAFPLKQALASMGFPEPEDRGEKEAKVKGFDFTWRELIQTLGTEWGRERDPDLWLKLAMREVDRIHLTPCSVVVITDVRFENEASAIRQRGGQVWHIVGRKAALVGDTKSHVSEKSPAVLEGDKVLHNTGTLEELEAAVCQLWETYDV